MDLFEIITYTLLKDNFEMLKITIIIHFEYHQVTGNIHYLYDLLYPGLKLKLPMHSFTLCLSLLFFAFKIACIFR